jgi:hypothetical protein
MRDPLLRQLEHGAFSLRPNAEGAPPLRLVTELGWRYTAPPVGREGAASTAGSMAPVRSYAVLALNPDAD